MRLQSGRLAIISKNWKKNPKKRNLAQKSEKVINLSPFPFSNKSLQEELQQLVERIMFHQL